jgi:hypothetical protein
MPCFANSANLGLLRFRAPRPAQAPRNLAVKPQNPHQTNVLAPNPNQSLCPTSSACCNQLLDMSIKMAMNTLLSNTLPTGHGQLHGPIHMTVNQAI